MIKEKSNYYEKLKDPRWQKKRLKILERDKWTCQNPKCRATEETLNVHHKVYLPKTEPWDIEDRFLITLCENCHKSITEYYPISLNELNQAIKYYFPFVDNLSFLTDIIEFNTDIPSEKFLQVLLHITTNRDLFNSLWEEREKSMVKNG